VQCRLARRLGRALGRRGAILLSYGTVWALYGYGQFISPPAEQPGLTLAVQMMPLHAWAILWIGTGLLAVVAAWLKQGVDWFGFVALVLIVLPWMLSYFVSWLQGDFPRGWVAAAVWAAIAVPVLVVAGWREAPRPKRVEGY
jgi:peptidoglycan/LPS O-acetylase OafA/YrhL